MTKLFAISDQHYGHQNIIKYCNRDLSLLEAKSIGLQDEVHFSNLSAIDDAKAMIIAHNSVVSDDEVVIFCGDVSASRQGTIWLPKIVQKLKGQKHLVLGNHDHLSKEEYLKMGFLSVNTSLKVNNFMFHHYPDTPQVIDVCQRENLILCCGHTHKEFKDYNDNVKRINVSVDVMGRTPFFLGDF